MESDPWEKMREDSQFSNIRQVLSYPKELSQIGCFIELKDKVDEEENEFKKKLFSKEEVKEFKE